MEIVAVFIYAKGCPACTEFKRSADAQMKRTLSLRGIVTIEYTAESIAGFGPTASPSFLQYISFYPCIMLIETKVLLNCDKLSDSLCLSLSSVFNGKFFVKGSPKALDYVAGMYPSNNEGYSRFADDFIEKRTLERSILYSAREEVIEATNQRGNVHNDRATPVKQTPSIMSRLSINNK